MKAALVCVAALTLARVCRNSRAAARHLVFAAVFAVLLTLPVAMVVMPPTIVQVPIARDDVRAMTELVAVPDAEPEKGSRAARPEPASAFRTSASLEPWRAAWLAGVAFFLAPVVRGLWELRRIRRRSVPWPEGQAVVDGLAVESGVGGRIEVLRHASISGPLTCGVFRPAILLPADVQDWNRDALLGALTHEIEHVRRADWLTLCASRLVCALYWFHPLVWRAWRRLALEAERACDDAVLSRNEAAEYASLLVAVAQRESARARHLRLAMASRGDLSARVHAVLDKHQRRGRAGRASVIASAAAAVVLIVAVAPVVLVAGTQTTEGVAPRSFEVASVKQNRSGNRGFRAGFAPGGRLTATNATLRQLIGLAFSEGQILQGDEMIGGPGWLDTDRFDVEAKAPGTIEPTPSDLRAMTKALLADRFKVVAHMEQRERPVYLLMLAEAGRLGPGLRPSSGADCQSSGPPASDSAALDRCGHTVIGNRWTARNVTMEGLARQLLGGVVVDLGRLVVDRTDLRGSFSFDIEFERGEPGRGQASPEPAERSEALSIFTVMREQLGLKLEPSRMTANILVIDSAERPTEN